MTETTPATAGPGVKAEAEPFSAIGARVGDRFVVLDLVGRGGMGEVYRVRDEQSGHELALKRLRPSRGARSMPLALFEREYHTLAQLAHPCIIQVYDYGVDQEGAYYTMELLAGMDLSRRGRLDWRAGCSVLRDVASALAVMHSRRWLHRDPSPRNVMCTDDGRSKLIDFGAMAPIGNSRGVVGTPPLVPPEALQQQALDVRADLYSLGALAYWLLTGRHAYPALRFDELPDVWRSYPRAPEKITSEIPTPLSNLVLELLSLDRAARPPCAADVIERLNALLGDREQAPAEVGAAYLSTPKLVGRDRELLQARKQLVKTLRGKGSALLIEAESGGGRSRFLDACVLEAKLLGATVLRADASEGARGDYGVASAIGEQLLQALPHVAGHAARLQRVVLGTVIAGLRTAEDDPAFRPERRHLQAALRDWFRAVARNKRLVLAIDDVDRIDEPSAAWLASLVHRNERRKLVVLATTRPDASARPALELLKSSSSLVALLPLSLTESEALLQSVFGNARDLASVAQRAHALSRGNAAQLMQLAEHLVAHGHARYVAGSWLLPERLPSDALPPSVDAALGASFDRLSSDARELAEVLSLTDPASIDLAHYPTLVGHADHARLFAALSDLSRAFVLQPEADRYGFVHTRWPELIAERTLPVQRRSLHARLSQVVDASAEPMRAARHLMESGQERAAIELMLTVRLKDGRLLSAGLVELLERAVAVSTGLGLSAHQSTALRCWLAQAGGLLGKQAVFLQHAPQVVQELSRASGLSDFEALADAPAGQRLMLAFGAAKQRHDALPEQARPYPPIDAVLDLAMLAAACTALAQAAMDASFLGVLPSLAPFLPLSPAIWIVETLNQTVIETQAGRRCLGHQLGMSVLERLDQPDRAGLLDVAYARARNAVILMLADYEACNGRAQALTRLNELLEQPGYRADAWRQKAIYHLAQGQIEESRRCERRADLVLLQDGTMQFGEGRSLLAQAIVYCLSDDLEGLKQLLPRTERMAERFPRCKVLALWTRCHYLRLTGDLAAALALCLENAPLAPPGTHILSAWVAAAQVSLLSAAGRAAEAADHGLGSLEAFELRRFAAEESRPVALATAEALASAARFEAAVALADTAVTELEAIGEQGVCMGVCYETRARVALAMRDQSGFARWAERCRPHYTSGDSPALSAKFGRLLQLAGREQTDIGRERSADSGNAEAGNATEWSRMQECVSAGERARCALLLLLEHCHADQAHLFGLLGGRFSPLASLPANPPDGALIEALERHVQEQVRSMQTTAITLGTCDSSDDQSDASDARTPLTERFHVMLLQSSQDTASVLVAIALVPRAQQHRPPSYKFLAVLADSLLAHDDVDPIM